MKHAPKKKSRSQMEHVPAYVAIVNVVRKKEPRNHGGLQLPKLLHFSLERVAFHPQTTHPLHLSI